MDDRFRKQFMLSARAFDVPDGWVSRTVGTYRLAHCPSVPVHEVVLDGGTRPEERGVLVGWTLATLAAPHPARLELRSDAMGDIGGRWVYVSERDVRLDPRGSFSVVYDAEAGIAASSTAVMPPGLLEEDESLNAALGLPKARTWYPFGLTPYRNVRRLLPNHALRLGRFEPERVPRRATPVDATDDEAHFDVIARSLREGLRALAEAGPLTVALTAGYDSRMILAGLRGYTDAASFFTIQPWRMENLDVHTARRLAKKFGLDHRVLLRVRDAGVERCWFERTGRSVGAGALRNAAIMPMLPPDHVYLKGMGGGLGKGCYYQPGDRPDTPLTAEEVVSRCGLPPHAAILQACREWMADVVAETADTFDLLDLLYIEVREGCWASPLDLGDVTPTVCVWPLNLASIVEATRRLSYETKTRKSLTTEVVGRLWPELLSVPINEAYGLYEVKELARRAKRKLRMTLGRLGGPPIADGSARGGSRETPSRWHGTTADSTRRSGGTAA